MRISDWSSDVCSSDLRRDFRRDGAVGLGADVEQQIAVLADDIDQIGDQRGCRPIGIVLGIAPAMHAHRGIRSEARRVGKECVSTCSYRWSPYHYKNTTTLTNRNQSTTLHYTSS